MAHFSTPHSQEVFLMKLGFFTMPLHPPGSDLTRTMDDDMEQIVILDELGYIEAWIGEHFTFEWENIPSPELFIAKALGLTKNIVFGTGVTCMPIHNPASVAHRIAQLDHLAHGRFYWGVGSSSVPGDRELFMFDDEKGDRRKATREGVDAVLQIWEDPKPGLYESDYWSSGASGKDRLETSRQTLPEASPTDRDGWRIPQIGHAGVGGRAGLDSHESESGAYGNRSDSLGCSGRGGPKDRSDSGSFDVAHRTGSLRG